MAMAMATIINMERHNGAMQSAEQNQANVGRIDTRPARRPLLLAYAARSFILRLVRLPQFVRKLLVAIFDVLLCLAAVWAGFLLRVGELRVGTRPALIFAAIAIVAWLLSTQVMRTYRSVVRYSGGHTLVNLAQTCALLCAILVVAVLSIRIDGVPRTLAVIHPVLLFLFLSVERIFLSQLILGSLSGGKRTTTRKRILIYGAGSAGQRAIGTGVMGGMMTATLLAVFFVPIFFVVVRRIFKGSERQRKMYAHESDDGAPKAPAQGDSHA